MRFIESSACVASRRTSSSRFWLVLTFAYLVILGGCVGAGLPAPPRGPLRLPVGAIASVRDIAGDTVVLLDRSRMPGEHRVAGWLVQKLGPSGDRRWSVAIGEDLDIAKKPSIVVDSNNYIAVGFLTWKVTDPSLRTPRHFKSAREMVVVKLDEDGRQKWRATLPVVECKDHCLMASGNEGSVLVIGYFRHGYDISMQDMEPPVSWRETSYQSIVKVDDDGHTQWTRDLFDKRNCVRINVSDVATDKRGNVLLAGAEQGIPDFVGNLSLHSAAVVLKWDPSGSPLWKASFEQAWVAHRIALGPRGNAVVHVSATPDRDRLSGTGNPPTAPWLVMLDPDGKTMWSKSAPFAAFPDVSSLEATSDGSTRVEGATTRSLDLGGVTVRMAHFGAVYDSGGRLVSHRILRSLGETPTNSTATTAAPPR